MALIERPSGLLVDLPEGLVVGKMASPRPAGRRRATPADPAVPSDAQSAAAETAVVIAALQDQQMELVDALPLQPAAGLTPRPPGGAQRARGPSVAARQTVEVRVPIKADEHAVVLLEQDGVYHWKLPDKVARPRRPQGRSPGVEPEGGVATFQIAILATPPRRQTRGVVSHLLHGAARVFVLKFAAHAVVGKVMTHLERHVRTGLVGVSSADPTKWTPIEPSELKLPRDRPARILLLVHGTFSSTIGAFSGLAAHDWGKAFLEEAFSRYDAVLGFDHRTLSVDPLENASELLAVLQSLKTPSAPLFDIVTHSRGALVARSLIELLLPFEREWTPRVKHVVFVAATNHGTRLAEPDNWHQFVNLYTNVALAGTRALGLVPQAKLFALAAGGVIQGVGALVKFLIDAVVTDQGAPGLAAMEPDGEFVTKLNQAQPGQPDPQHSSYYVVTSDFEPRGEGEGPKEMPPALLMMLADGFVDRLFKVSNDLVVDVESMSAIDPTVGGFVDDTYDFHRSRLVYHCNYFVRPEVADVLTNWLGLSPPAAATLTRSRERRVRGVAHQRLSASANTNLIEAGPDEMGSAVAEALRAAGADYVVIQRRRSDGGYVYAFDPDEVFAATDGKRGEAPIRESLKLGEDRASRQVGGGRPRVLGGRSGFRTTQRTVIFVGADPVGVLPEPTPPPPLTEAEPPAAHRTARSQRSTARRKTRVASSHRYMPRPGASVGAGVGGWGGGGGGMAAAPARSRRRRAATRRAAPPTTPHVYADMPPQVPVGATVSVHVEISAHELVRASGKAAKGGKIADAFDPSKPLIVQVLARTNFEVVGDDRATVQAPGPDDASVELYFDVAATHAGGGEVWVMLRQGAPPLLTLILTPEIATARAAAGRSRLGGSARAESLIPETVPVGWSLPTLRVNERSSGDSTVFEYDLDLLKDGTYQFKSAPIIGDRDAYVNRIYKDLEETWATSKSDIKKFQDDVRSYGGELFDELFPPELQKLLWQHRNNLKNIRVLSAEPFIPWELVHLKNPATGRLPGSTSIFLAQMGLVRWLWNTPAAPAQLQIRPGKAWYVVPDYPDPDYVLTETASEGIFLADSFGAKPVVPKTDRVMALLTKPNRVDLFHFAGHGGATGGGVEDARIFLQGRIGPDHSYTTDELTARRIRQEGNLADPDKPVRPLVVLNACQAGRAGMQLSSIGGFAEAFIHAGAGAFVSSLWSVGDEPAASFTTAFYAQLKRGNSIAKATVAARDKAHKAGDATWLAYVVYAHPDAKLI